MFLRRCYRTHNGQRRAITHFVGTRALVESYRTARGPRQRVVSYLGSLQEPLGRGVMLAAGAPDLATQLPLPGEGQAEAVGTVWVEVDAARVRIERSRAFGGAWVALQVAEKLGLPEFLSRAVAQRCEEIPWPLMALVLVVGRLCEPGSELSLAEQGYERTALPELLGIPATKVNDDRLYRALDQLLPAKAALEQHRAAGPSPGDPAAAAGNAPAEEPSGVRGVVKKLAHFGAAASTVGPRFCYKLRNLG